MNTGLLKLFDDYYTMWHGQPPKYRGRAEVMRFISTITDIGITKVYEIAEDDYEPFGQYDYKTSVKVIFGFLGVSPEDFFGLPLDLKRCVRKPKGFTGQTFEEKPAHSMFSDSSEYAHLLLDGLHEIDPRMAKVLELLFLEGMSLDEVGQAQPEPLTRERVRQIKVEAIKILKKYVIPGLAMPKKQEPVVYFAMPATDDMNAWIAQTVISVTAAEDEAQGVTEISRRAA